MESKINLVFKEEQSKYEQARIRVTRHYNNRNMSDKEIIELLAEEIEQYREKIQKQEEYIKQLQDRQIQGEVLELDTTEDEVVDKDIIEIISTTQYADGKPIQSKIEYKYKEN